MTNDIWSFRIRKLSGGTLKLSVTTGNSTLDVTSIMNSGITLRSGENFVDAAAATRSAGASKHIYMVVL